MRPRPYWLQSDGDLNPQWRRKWREEWLPPIRRPATALAAHRPLIKNITTADNNSRVLDNSEARRVAEALFAHGARGMTARDDDDLPDIRQQPRRPRGELFERLFGQADQQARHIERRWGRKGSLVLYLRGRNGPHWHCYESRPGRRHAGRDPACAEPGFCRRAGLGARLARDAASGRPARVELIAARPNRRRSRTKTCRRL